MNALTTKLKTFWSRTFRRWLLLAPALLVCPALCRADLSTEYALKAAFILNFLKFSEIPSKNPSTLVLCVFGDQEIFEVTELLNSKSVGEREVRVTFVNSISQLAQCEALFVPSSANQMAKAILGSPRVQGSLTIGEGTTFLEAGGMISLVTKDNKIRFAISGPHAERENIQLSAKLMALAISDGS